MTDSGEAAGATTFAIPGPLQFALTYDGKAGWQVVDVTFPGGGPLGPGPEVCSVGADLVQHELDTNNQNNRGMEWFGSPQDGIEGVCLAASAAGRHERRESIWRFGVLLAADAPAHALLPALPMAPPGEIAAVSG
jgi:hypothetical protein